MKATDPKAAEITALYSEIASEAFPYEDCRRLLATMNERAVEYLIPDLDLYFSNVASHASGIDRVLKWHLIARLTPQGSCRDHSSRCIRNTNASAR